MSISYIYIYIYIYVEMIDCDEYDTSQTHIWSSQPTLIKLIHYKKSLRLLEFSVIFKTNHQKQHPGFYQILLYLADILLHENNIKIENGYKKN